MVTFQSLGSAWRLHSVIDLKLYTETYNPSRRESCITLPKELPSKKAIINIKNTDNKCLLWSVHGALNPKKHPSRRR